MGVLVAPGGARGRSPETIARTLRGFADQGIGHVQIVLPPSTAAAVEAFAPVLGLLDRAELLDRT